jgi:hypothetical protein
MLVAFDQFPVDVVVNGGVRYPQVRILVTPAGDARLFGVRDGTVAVLAASTVTAELDARRQVSQVETADGVWTVAASGGCGCGHVLRRVTREALVELAGLR